MKNLVLVFSLITITCFASKIKPFAELSGSFYAPYPTIKFDLNGGVMFNNYKVQHYVSIGIGIGIGNSFSTKYSYNIKETMVFKKEILNHFEPLVSFQFKYNNQRQYNYINLLYYETEPRYKNSLIVMPGLQVSLKKYKTNFQFQTGLSYNFEEVGDYSEPLLNKAKEGKDIFLNSISSISIVKLF